jgi:hypothetical protein
MDISEPRTAAQLPITRALWRPFLIMLPPNSEPTARPIVAAPVNRAEKCSSCTLVHSGPSYALSAGQTKLLADKACPKLRLPQNNTSVIEARKQVSGFRPSASISE